MDKNLLTENHTDYQIADTNLEFDNSLRAKAAFGYYGCKQRLAPKIRDMVPDHKCWVDLFCGSAAVTLAKDPAPIEIINDIDSNIVNVFKQLRENSEELIQAIELTPYSREEFENARSIQKCNTNIERARTFLIEAMMSINGVMAGSKGSFSLSDSYSRGSMEARVNRWRNYPDRLKKVVERMKHVRIENMDARELLARFSNRPATLVYIDPPYLMDRTSKYTHDISSEDFHEELLELCVETKCMVLISSYENSIYNSILSEEKGWQKEIINTHTKGTSGASHHREEVVWKNKVLIDASRSGCCIELTEKETAQKKVNPERT